MNLIIAENNGVKPMLSIDMVDYINATRKYEAPKLAHSDFLKKVPKVLGEEAAGKFTASYRDSSGKANPCYSLPKREACLMAMSYSYELQADIFDRWQGLEVQQTPQVPQTMAQALRLAADQAETIEQQAQQLQLAAPAVQFMNDFVVAKGDVSLRGAAKELGHSPIAFNRQLGELGIIYKLDGVWTAKQSQVNAGRLAMKVAICDDGEHRPQCTITPKGMEYIAVKLAELNAGAE